MKELCIYSIVLIPIYFHLSISNKIELTDIDNDNRIKYYYHEQNCLNIVKRCDLEIVKLINTDTLIYVSSSEHFGDYKEIWGKLTRINDSIYYVKCFRSIEQNETMPAYGISKDSITFYCDSSLIGNTFKIEYLNKKTESYKIYSNVNRFHIDKNQFNSKSKNIIVSFYYPHPIANETVELKISFRRDILFITDKRPDDFYIVISGSKIKTLNAYSDADITIEPKFVLKEMTIDDKLNRGRLLR